MSRIVALVLVLLAILAILGVLLPAVYHSRGEEEMRRCQNNLRQIGSTGLLHAVMPGEPVPFEAQSRIPAATIVNEKLKFDERLSWYLLIVPAVEHGVPVPGAKAGPATSLDEKLRAVNLNLAWDAEPQTALAATQLKFAQCPVWRPEPAAVHGMTTYLGNGGIGAQTPAMALEQAGRNAGVFRYDTATSLEAIRDADGLSYSLLVGESASNPGPWLQGGPATVRTLNAEALPPFLGKGRLYAGLHRGRGNFAFTDGSVRVLTDRTNSAVFKAMLTIDGREVNEFVNE